MRAPALSLIVALSMAFAGISAQAQERMLAHDVYFSLKDNSPLAKEKLVATCKKYLTDHPGTVSFAVGPLADDLKRDVNDRDFDVALHMVFKDKAAYDQYAKSERHLKCIAENKDNSKKVRVFDSYVEVIAGGKSVPPKADARLVSSARVQIDLLNTAIETYHIATGEYPTTQQGLQALRVPPAGLAKPASWDGPYLDKEVPLDPWQRPYRYKSPGKHNAGQADIWSLGSDGVDDTTDDIGNWVKK